MLLEKIREAMPQMPAMYQKIAQYILDHGQDAAFSSISAMSAAIGVSNATLVRFVRSLRMSGYAEFKRSLQAEIKSTLNPYEKITLTDLDSLLDDAQIKKLYQNEINNLRKTFDGIDRSMLRRLLDEMTKADRIFISGFGLTRHLVRIFEYTLQSTLEKDIFVVSGSVSDYSPVIKIFQRGDIMILFTFPPYSEEGRHVASLVHERGGRLFLFTDSAHCPVYPYADAVMRCANNSMPLANSFVGLAAVLQVLANMIYIKGGEKGAMHRREISAIERHGYRMMGSPPAEA